MNIQEKLRQPENRRLEFKSELPAKLTDILKTITAFSNGSGGELIIGVTDRERTIVGVRDPLLLEEKMSNAVHDAITPLLSPYISVLHREGKEIVIVQVLPGSSKPYYIRSLGPEHGVYIRVGSTNRRATPDIIQELRRQSLGIAFETESDVTKSPEDLDTGSLLEFFRAIGQAQPTSDTLTKWFLLRKNNGKFFPTIAGIILFGKSTLADYDFAGIRLTRFMGNTMSNIGETREYLVPILPKIETIIQDTAYLLRKESYLEGIRLLERTIIPFYAIREVIINAIAHRDYSIRDATIKINVFDNRLEVISPGVLPGTLSLADLGTGLSGCRNRAIVKILRKMNMMEELGTGIARIYELWKEKPLKSPEFLEQGQFFKAILPQEPDSERV